MWSLPLLDGRGLALLLGDGGEEAGAETAVAVSARLWKVATTAARAMTALGEVST